MIGIHLSRLSEQLIIFSSSEFGFVAIDDAYATGSSIMPQKKNPDTLELTRGKSGRLIGHLTGLLATLKGLPSAYDKDLQEDKEPVFDAYDTLAVALPVMTGLIESMNVRTEKIAGQLEPGLLATELADYLTRRGLPFRDAHEVAGRVVLLSEQRGLALTELGLAELREASPIFEDDVFATLSFKSALGKRVVPGSTGPHVLAEQLAAARRLLSG
jgi:argininosuccinate lyase